MALYGTVRVTRLSKMYPCLTCSADWGNRTVVGRLSQKEKAVRRTAVSHGVGDVVESEGSDP